jgi:hypothetical protein
VPLVSIVINNFNYERFLADAVESALAQTHADIEVVVVDDGSTDGSRGVLDRFRGRIRPVLRANGGQAAAVNSGWEASRGELVLLLDADDHLHPWAAQQVVDAAAHSSDGVFWAALDMVDEARRPLGRRTPRAPFLSGDLSGRVLRGQPFTVPATSGIAFRRSAVAELFPIPEGWRIGADQYLDVVAPLVARVAALPRTAGEYRLHGRNSWAPPAVDAAWLRRALALDRGKEMAVRDAAARTLRSVRPALGEWGLGDPQHVQARLASLRLDPAGHPEPGDRALALALRGARAALVDPTYSPRKRLLFAAWFLALAGAPRGAARRLIELGYHDERRPELFRRLLS